MEIFGDGVWGTGMHENEPGWECNERRASNRADRAGGTCHRAPADYLIGDRCGGGLHHRSATCALSLHGRLSSGNGQCQARHLFHEVAWSWGSVI